MQSLSTLAFFKDVTGFDFDKFDRRVIWKRCADGETSVDFGTSRPTSISDDGRSPRVLLRRLPARK